MKQIIIDTINLPGITDENKKGNYNNKKEIGRLTRVYPYHGPAWYQGELEIPVEWDEKEIIFFMELTKASTVWVDNPNYSSRWYPGGGIYRNVWLTKTNPVHVAQWGTYITTKDVSKESATIDLKVTIDNDSKTDVTVEVATSIYDLDSEWKRTGEAVASSSPLKTRIKADEYMVNIYPCNHLYYILLHLSQIY